MPFPYAYYKEEYNGPLHGTELESPVLYLTPAKIELTGGSVDVTGKSHLIVDTTAGSILISDFIGGKDGQVLILYKSVTNNTLNIQHEVGSNQKIRIANKQTLQFGGFQYGGAMFICRQEGALFYWYQIDTNGLYNSGSATAPSISFAQDTDTGIFRKTTDTLAIAAGGNEVASWSNMLVTSAIPHLFTTGTSTAPAISFISDPDTGFYKLTDKIVLTADAVDKFAFTKIGTIQTAGDLSFTLMDGLTPIKLIAGSMMVSNAADDALIPVNGIYSKGNVRTGGQFLGTATSALYADLAERYESDMILEPGTICEIGGEKEITIAVNGNRVFGIISTNPGFKLNAEAGDDATHPFVALAGKVPCRLVGKIKKGDEVQLSAIPGVGELRKYSDSYSSCVGRALENKDTDEEGLVMVVTRAVI